MIDTGRRRCVVCYRGALTDDEPQTCRRCTRQTVNNLTAITRLHGLLAAEIEGRAGAAGNGNGRSGFSHSLPMGHILSLLGPGSDATTDSQADDMPSIAWELSRWEDDWRHTRGHCAATGPANVTTAVAYLAENNQWAANRHPAYDEYASDLAKLLATLSIAMQVSTAPRVMPAKCVDCGGKMLQDYQPPMPCQHKGEHRTDCDQGGLRDHVRCDRCGRHYTAAAYTLALRQLLEAAVVAAADATAAMQQLRETVAGMPVAP